MKNQHRLKGDIKLLFLFPKANIATVSYWKRLLMIANVQFGPMHVYVNIRPIVSSEIYISIGMRRMTALKDFSFRRQPPEFGRCNKRIRYSRSGIPKKRKINQKYGNSGNFGWN